jgi:hypothetical protein
MVVQDVPDDPGHIASLLEVLGESGAAEVEVAVSGAEVFVWLGKMSRKGETEKGTYEEMGHVGLEGEVGSGRVEEGDMVDMDVDGTGGGGPDSTWGSEGDSAVDEDGRVRGHGLEHGVGVDKQLGCAGVVGDVEE